MWIFGELSLCGGSAGEKTTKRRMKLQVESCAFSSVVHSRLVRVDLFVLGFRTPQHLH